MTYIILTYVTQTFQHTYLSFYLLQPKPDSYIFGKMFLQIMILYHRAILIYKLLDVPSSGNGKHCRFL